MSTLERAIAIAVAAHAGQVDKGGAPYILHPLRVMLAQKTERARIVGVLHDVVEDCPGWTFERLRQEGFDDEVLAALDALTRRPGETYAAFVLRAGADPIGRAVKLDDLRDNADLSRLPSPTPRDHERAERYQRSIGVLLSLERFLGAPAP